MRPSQKRTGKREKKKLLGATHPVNLGGKRGMIVERSRCGQFEEQGLKGKGKRQNLPNTDSGE